MWTEKQKGEEDAKKVREDRERNERGEKLGILMIMSVYSPTQITFLSLAYFHMTSCGYGDVN